MAILPLSEAPVGKKVRLVAIDGGRQLEVEVLHHRGRGVVVAKQGNRVALGGGMAEKLRAEEID